MNITSPTELGFYAVVLSMTLSPKGRSVRIGFRRPHNTRREYASLSRDEVRNRDVRVGDVVALGEKAAGRYAVVRPVLELRSTDAEAFA